MESGGIAHHDDVGIEGKGVFELEEGVSIGFVEDIVGVEPGDIVAGCLGKGKISGGGKVVAPREIEYFIGKGTGGYLSAVGRAGIDDDDLVKDIFYAFQAFWEGFFFILNDHTKGKFHADTSKK